MSTSPVVVGAGLAGLVTALQLAPLPCTVITTGGLGSLAASRCAQGGLAAALGPEDSPSLHTADTLAAGAGLCDMPAVRRTTEAAPAVVAYLAGLGARFDRTADGAFRLGLEGAHSRHRIVHAAGDGSGAEIMRAVVAAVRGTTSITVLEHTRALDLAVRAGAVVGVLVDSPAGPRTIPADRVVLATGGTGGLWSHTTNPHGALGQGLALAARAGAWLRDLEMVQFHPTALDVGGDPMPLMSEAIRGAGAVLVDERGAPLLPDSLAARDVVARAVYARTHQGLGVYLDTRGSLGGRLTVDFPAFGSACLDAGIDPETDLVPIRAAAHYHCGGVTVNEHGRTSVPGLWACGEVASSGLHGANRLASNSLLEAVVLGQAVARDLTTCEGGRADVTHPARPQPPAHPVAPVPGRPHPHDTLPSIRALMEDAAGVLRDDSSLRAATEQLRATAYRTAPGRLHDAAVTALLVCASALVRTESRGGHARTDHPDPASDARHTQIRLADVLEPAGTAVPRSA